VQRILDGITAMPAIIMNVRLDLLSASRLGYALYSPVYDDHPARPVNLARFTFLSPHATALYPDWDLAADTTVAMLRTEARHPYNRELPAVIGELSTRSDTFRNRWAAHNVQLHRSGTKRFHHPVIGDVSFAYEVMQLSAEAGLTLTAYSPEPNSTSEDALTPCELSRHP
jgi:MmyB-like transcription regulator ligand binding domain